ncbi:MAG: hypothetical protein HRU15_05775 [Planctomycetes bacterium]|nr:hypothetical protein [Planctomycetota bacterium]
MTRLTIILASICALCLGYGNGNLISAEDFDIDALYKSPVEKWENKIKQFEAYAAKGHLKEGSIVCVGSSSMAMWHSRIEKDLAPLTIIKRGFGGSNYHDAIHYAHRIITNYKPRAVLVYEGDNDTAQGVSPENVQRACQLFVKTLRDELPELRIYLISVKPSFARASMWDRMQAANALMKTYCEQNDYLTFIDIATPLHNPDGTLMDDIFIKDKLHLNQKGYDIWSKTIKDVLFKSEGAYEK